LEKLKHQKTLLKKIAKTINFLEENPRHPGLRIERITNNPTAWSARVDKSYRISFEPVAFLTPVFRIGRQDLSSYAFLIMMIFTKHLANPNPTWVTSRQI